MTSSVALAAAQATTLPPYVPPCEPGGSRSMSARRAMIPDSGRPEAMPLAMTRMSGSTSQWLHREHLAGPPEARLDLVGDQQDPVLAA